MLGGQRVEQVVEAHLVHLLLHAQQGRIAVHLAGNDVELTARRSLLGIHVVPLAGGRQSTFLMEILGIDKLGRDGIAHIARTQHLTLGRVLRIGVACLYHEVLDDTVKEGSLIGTVLGQLDEIVPMLGSFVVQLHHDVARGGFNLQFGFFAHIFRFFIRFAGHKAANQDG